MDGNVEGARLSGNAQTLAWALYGLALVAIAAGDLERAIAAAQEAVDVADDGTPNHHGAGSRVEVARIVERADRLAAQPT